MHDDSACLARDGFSRPLCGCYANSANLGLKTGSSSAVIAPSASISASTSEHASSWWRRSFFGIAREFVKFAAYMLALPFLMLAIIVYILFIEEKPRRDN